MDERRNQIIVGGVVTVVVIVVIALIATKSSGPACDLQADPPKVDLTQVKTIVSSKNDALVKFAGFVKYEHNATDKDDKAYLLLNTQSVLKDGEKDKKNVVTVDAECGTVQFDLLADQATPTLVRYKTGTVTLELVTPNGDNHSCTMDFGISYDKGKHYRCQKVKTYPCTTKSKDDKDKEKVVTVATLNVAYLEFELDGDAAKAKNGQFSTDAVECN